jgi:hypothetical protein
MRQTEKKTGVFLSLFAEIEKKTPPTFHFIPSAALRWPPVGSAARAVDCYSPGVSLAAARREGQ